MYWVKLIKYALNQDSRVKEYRSHSSLLLNWYVFFYQQSDLKGLFLKKLQGDFQVPIFLSVCVFALVLISCVIAAAIILPLTILAAWPIYKVYRFLYPKTKLPELLKVCVSCGSTVLYMCNILNFSLSDHKNVLFI